MNANIRANSRAALVETGQIALARGSVRLWLAGAYRRRVLVEAWLDWRDAAGLKHEVQGNQDSFELYCRGIGISPLVILLIGIAWDLLWYWWTHRKDA